MDLREFLDWEHRQDIPFEFLHGQVLSLETSTQQKALLITDIICAAREAVRCSSVRVLSRMRLSIPTIQEVRYLDVVLDAGPYAADALEPVEPILIIDVGRTRDFSMLDGVAYLSVPLGADVKEVAEEIRAVLRSIRT